jgi:ubiquinone/menaquinone biosynthesis C-methylase UbiE
MRKRKPGYIHGYTKIEQDRLLRQAEFMESLLYRDVNFSMVDNIIEVGSGVGAQTQILLRRFPNLHITCVDINEKQIEEAKKNLKKHLYTKNRFEIHQMSAEKLTFSDNSFQGAFLCWILEHVPHPSRVLSEVRRVLAPGSRVVITEVMNFAYFLDPYCPAIWKFWMTLNDQQYDQGGDPFIGVKLGTFLRDAGFTDVQTNILSLYADKREPELRRRVLQDREELVFNAASELLSQGRVTESHVNSMKKEFRDILKNPNSISFELFMQATARVP